MNRERLTPMDLCENPALGILAILQRSLDVARLGLWAAHSESQDEILSQTPQEARAQAYAFAILVQMQALGDTIRSYRESLGSLHRHGEAGEDPDDDGPPF